MNATVASDTGHPRHASERRLVGTLGDAGLRDYRCEVAVRRNVEGGVGDLNSKGGDPLASEVRQLVGRPRFDGYQVSSCHAQVDGARRRGDVEG